MGRRPFRWSRVARLTALVALLAAGAGCGGGSAPSPVVLVAIDGLEWDLLLPLLRQGNLPRLAGLVERGRCGLLATTEPTFSPIIWTTIATGKAAASHGIEGFVRRSADTGAPPRVYNSHDRRSKAFWNILSDYGRSVAVVGWWMTFPTEPVNGVMVAQVNTLDQADRRRGRAILKGGLREGLAGQVHPPQRLQEFLDLHLQVSAELGDRTRAIFGDLGRPMPPLVGRLWENTQWALRSDAAYIEIAERLAEERFDLLAVYLGGVDVVSHRFWRHMAPEIYDHPPPASEVDEFGDVIETYYRYVDSAIGRVIDAVPGRPRVLVVSDHGMHATGLPRKFRADRIPADVTSGGHADGPPGVWIASGPGVEPAAPPIAPGELARGDLPAGATVFDVTPTLLALLGVPAGRDMPGRPLPSVAAPGGAAVPTVATHDNREWLARRARLDPDRQQRPEDRQRLEQLRALGYID